MKTSKTGNGRTIIGLLLIFIGSLIFFERVGMISGSTTDFIFSIPALIMFVGAVSYLNSSNKLFGTIVFLIGAFLMTGRIFPELNIDYKLIFPVIIISFGLYLLLRNRKTTHYFSGTSDNADNSDISNKKDFIDDIAIFGGGEKIIFSENFRGGKITTIFGGTEIDLTNCKLAEGDQVIDIFSVFGGCEIRVPRDWKVQTDVLPLFGGFSNKLRRRSEDVVLTPQTLYIKGVAIFGGGEIKGN